MSEPLSGTQETATNVAANINGEDSLSNSAYHSFRSQESSHLFHSSETFENLHVFHSNNLRSSTPESSAVSHSNDVPSSPEIASFVNCSSNLRSSTPKASSLLSPFESDLTEVKLDGGNAIDMSRNTSVYNKIDISNDIFDLLSDINYSQNINKSDYKDCTNNSSNYLQLKHQSIDNVPRTCVGVSKQQLSGISSESPMIIDKAFKVPNEDPPNNMNNYGTAGNILNSSSTVSSFNKPKHFLPNSDEKCVDVENNSCNSKSLFESYDILSSELISFKDDLNCKPNQSYLETTNLIDLSSDLDSTLSSTSFEAFRSTDELASKMSLTVNSRNNRTTDETTRDILYKMSPEIGNICSPHHHNTVAKICPFIDKSKVKENVFCVTSETENVAEFFENKSTKSKIYNLSELNSENTLDPFEVNEITTQDKYNFEKVDLKNEFVSSKICNDDKNDITEYQTDFQLRGMSQKKMINQEILIKTNKARNENTFTATTYQELTNLTKGMFSGRLNAYSDFFKSKMHSAESFFAPSKPEPITIEGCCENSAEKYLSQTGKLLRELAPLKMDCQDDFKMFSNNFQKLIENGFQNFNSLNIPISKAQESILNFKICKELKPLNSNLLISSSFTQPRTISKQKLLIDKSTVFNSCVSLRSHKEDVNLEIKPNDFISRNFGISLRFDLPPTSINIQNFTCKLNGTPLEINNTNTNLNRYDSQIPKKGEYFESNDNTYPNNAMIFKSKEFHNISTVASFPSIDDKFLQSQSNMFESSRFSENSFETYNNFPASTIATLVKPDSRHENDPSESDESMISSSGSDSSINSKKLQERNKNLLPLQELFDIDKRVSKAVVQTFTDLGSNRGLKQPQIVKHINQQKMIKTHSKLNRDIQNFLKVAAEVGIMKKKGFKYFLSEGESSRSIKRKETKCIIPKRKEESKMKFPSSAIKTRTAAVEMVTPTRTAVYKTETPTSIKTEAKPHALDMGTPTRIKRTVAFKVETPSSARTKQFRKNLPNSSKRKCLSLGNKIKSSVGQIKTQVASPMVFKRLRSRVILMQKKAT